MLGPGRYLLGVAEIAVLIGFALLGASRVRSRLLPQLGGAPACLATAVLALALLIWVAEILGTFSLFKPLPYLFAVAASGLLLRFLIAEDLSVPPAGGVGAGVPRGAEARQRRAPWGMPPRQDPPAGTSSPSAVAPWIALVIAAVAVVHFGAGVEARLSTGMTGFDSTWYHGPFAAGFFQSGDTWNLHFIAPQFLAWFYPANGEIFHAVGMMAFGRDLLSPLLNLGWFVGCLVAAWCIGRPYRVAPFSLGLAAIALSVPALSDQAGEARNDVVGIFFLLAAVAIALNARAGERGERQAGRGEGSGRRWGPKNGADGDASRGLPLGALVAVGLSAGLAAGTKLNFLLPAAVLVVGLAGIVQRGGRWRALWVSALAALAGGGYWYLRNLVHGGNPLPWIHHLGPISLPAPQQALGGRETHSVLGYLTDGGVWSDWFLPGLHHGLWVVWPLLGAAALAGLLLCLLPDRETSGGGDRSRPGRAPRTAGSSSPLEEGEPRAWWQRLDPVLTVAALVGLATALSWLVAPTSASGPDGMPRGFESGLRYLAPALVLGLALFPATPLLRDFFASFGVRQSFGSHSATKDCRTRSGLPARRLIAALAAIGLLLAIAIGYPVQRHYLQSRYANPSFTTPGLDAAFAWARDVSGARIATTSTRQYPFFGTDLSNHVQFVGEETAHGGFEAPTTCRAWRHAIDAGHYDYVIATRDRLEPNKPPYPPQARWTEGPGAKVILRRPPTVVFQLTDRLDPSACAG